VSEQSTTHDGSRLNANENPDANLNAYWPATGIFLVACFPVIGSALTCSLWPAGRRHVQLLVLALGLLLFFISSRLKWAGAIKELWGRHKKQALAGFLALGIMSAINIATLRSFAATYEIINAFLIWGWLCLALVLYARRRSICVMPARAEAAPPPKNRIINGFVLAGFALAVLGWYHGPSETINAHLSFGGSTTSLGVCGAIGYFVVLITTRAPYNLFLALPWAYLGILSTARTPLLVAAVLFLFYFFYLIKQRKHAWYKAMATVCAAGLIVIGSIIFPLILKSNYYPYYGPDLEEEELGKRTEEFVRRFSRLYRLLPQPAAAPATPEQIVAAAVRREAEQEVIFWRTKTGKTSVEESVCVDLGPSAVADRVRMTPSKSQADIFPSRFVLDSSLDGKNWTTIDKAEAYELKDGAVYDKQFRALKTRYVRLRGHTRPMDERGHALVVAKFDVFGESARLPVESATSSSHINESYAPSKAFDGDENTCWHSMASDHSKDEWLALDLGSPADIDSMVIMRASGYDKLFPRPLQVEVSEDNNAWQPATDEIFPEGQIDERGLPVALRNAKSVRYVRIRGRGRMLDAKSKQHYALIGEVKLFGRRRPMQAQPVDPAAEKPGAVTFVISGENASVGGIALRGALPAQSVFPKDFRVEIGDDAGSWKTVANETGFNYDPETGYRASFLPVKARHVRISSLDSGAVFNKDRLPRIFFYPSQPPLCATLSTPWITSNKSFVKFKRDTGPKSVLAEIKNYAELVAELRDQPDDRWSIWKKGMATGLERPTGFWPVPYQEKTKGIYRYPHNFLIEIAYYYGGAVALLCCLGLLAVVLISTLGALRTGAVFEGILAIILLASFVRMQLSSDLADHLYVLALCWIWVASNVASGREHSK
jgi:hypothetical protein